MGSRKLPRSSLKEKKVQKRIKETNSTNGEKEEEEEKVVLETKKVQSKMTLCTTSTAQTRPTRRPGRPPIGKSYVGLQRQKEISAKVRSTYRRSLDPCDNSNDSGLGFGDHHMDPHHHRSDRLTWTGDRSESKRQKIDVKLEREEANDNYCFPENVLTSKDNVSLSRSAQTNAVSSPLDNGTAVRSVPRNVPFIDNKQSSTGIIPLTTQLMATSRYSNVSLQILKQPEQQHRARYQTEGSRGAVKDREGNGFPVVQLLNYYQPATLQVYIGTDAGRISPHIFYQACKVSGKNSTPCTETKIEGTCVIELQLDPSKDMKATCDCVGILKERNVDVEHRFPDQLGNRPKKKSTKCRMIFRTTITLDDGNKETLQVCSQPIVCTQPPGIPEICKKSLTSCPASGGLELFVLGKNFLKDTRVFFQQYEENQVRWEQTVVPDKEYLQQTHFVCVVPPYRRPDIAEPISVRLCVMSSGKTSESHQFVYTPVNGVPSVMVDALPPPPPFFKSNFWQSNASISKREQDQDMMPPPDTSLVPVSTRRPSMNLLQSINDSHSPPLCPLKQEYVDESSQCSLIDQDRYRHLSESSLDAHQGDSNISMLNENSMMSHMNDNSNISVGNEDTAIDIVRGGNEDSSSTPSTSILSEQTSAVMDLRMKLPIATVADLVNTTAPSIAALQRFGIMEHPTEPLPNQSAQSVENYLNKIEAKPSMIPLTNPTGLLMKNDLSRIINGREPMFPATNRPFMSCRSQNEVVNIVAKSESAEVPVPIPERNDTTASSTITTVSNSLERIVPTPINTEKLDALVNSTVESHLSPTSPKDVLVQEAIIPAGDVMLNPMMMTTTTTTTSILGRNELPDNPNLTTTTTEAILSTQISPSLMCANTRRRENLCRSAQRPLLTTAAAAAVTAPVNLASLTTEAEKVVLLNAAVDLLETQQQLHGIGGGGATAPADDFVARSYGSPMVKEMVPNTQNDKNKTVDGMIPQGFTALTENELISLINPSCFDQV
ncbi:uncharacterized protein LOC130894380 isoform X1 [Diorhabda carinulata]|uniref:uncharacterized protein LOC130894380 isoform X1 n=1 Tax=Diorhabda carinulata TaxID=1163345 RepID=UPI0025A02523|nr:uncharacterized protein LOC130894380 isoform X1 [Diorhabda carinulata]